MFRLFPRDEKFFEMFREAARNTVTGSQLLMKMTESTQPLEPVQREIEEVEHAGDRITHEIIRKLNRTFVTPIDREDIYQLASALDDILDGIKAAADRMAMYQIKEPTSEARRLAQLIDLCAREILKAIEKLEGFAGLDPHCVEINRLENDADDVMREAIARLFTPPQDPIEIIKWKEIYETLEIATDRCEDVANILEGVVLKNA